MSMIGSDDTGHCTSPGISLLIRGGGTEERVGGGGGYERGKGGGGAGLIIKCFNMSVRNKLTGHNLKMFIWGLVIVVLVYDKLTGPNLKMFIWGWGG